MKKNKGPIMGRTLKPLHEPDAEEISTLVQQAGGVRPSSRELGISAQAVSYWQHIGVPEERWEWLAERASVSEDEVWFASGGGVPGYTRRQLERAARV